VRKISKENKVRFENLTQVDCLTCGASGIQVHHVIGHGTSGMGMKSPDHLTIPLCVYCHDDLHRHGHKSWERKWGRDQLAMVDEANKILEFLERVS
jgi:predicted HNH restriction endonuclease